MYDINYNIDEIASYTLQDSSIIKNKYNFFGNSFTLDSRIALRKSEFALQLELNTPMEINYELSNNGVVSSERFDAFNSLQLSDLFLDINI